MGKKKKANARLKQNPADTISLQNLSAESRKNEAVEEEQEQTVQEEGQQQRRICL